MRAVGLEWYKLRRKRVGLMVILFLLVEIGWAFAATSMSISRRPDQAGWEPLIAMVSSMNGLFLPILTAICVSRICDMEHKGSTWKLLLTLSVRRGTLYAAKYLTAVLVMLAVCLLQATAMTAFGMVHDFEPAVSFVPLGRFVLGTMLTTMILIALQQWASMAVKNQAFALALGMVGGFLGLTGDLLPVQVSRFLIWSYYTGLSPITQSYTDESLHFIVREAAPMLPVMAALIAVGAVIYAAGSVHVSRQDV